MWVGLVPPSHHVDLFLCSFFFCCFFIWYLCNLPLSADTAPAGAAPAPCHGNILSDMTVVLRYVTRSLIYADTHEPINLPLWRATSLPSCYCHFLLGPVANWLNNVRERQNVLVISILKKKIKRVAPVETGYWTRRLEEGECLRGKCQQAAPGYSILLGSPGASRRPWGWPGEEDVWARLWNKRSECGDTSGKFFRTFITHGTLELIMHVILKKWKRCSQIFHQNPFLSTYSCHIASCLSTC